MTMTMTKRIQVPIDEPDLALIKAAAARSGVTLAEWARRLLREEARRSVGARHATPTDALAALFALDAPVAEVETMIEESVRGRLR
jgi:hypothetical protein